MHRLPFGKYRGRSLMTVAIDDQSYCDWLLGQPWFSEKYPTLQETLVAVRTGDRVATDESQCAITEAPPRRRSARRTRRQRSDQAIQANVAFLAPPEVLDSGCVLFRPRAFGQRA
jgi:hypothetical protein